MGGHYERHFSCEAAKRHDRSALAFQFQCKSRAWLNWSQRQTGTPRGFRVIRATVYTDGRRIVVTAEPDDVWPEHADCDDKHPHNCDAMGCRWEHVVARCELEKGGE